MNGKEKCSAKTRIFPRKVLLAFLIAGAIIAVGWGTVYAYERTSASYSTSIDALTAGGGETASASFREADGAVGQGAFFGEATSASYREQSGVVQAWGGPDPVTAAQHWADYEQADK